jgi:hypothetical protein
VLEDHQAHYRFGRSPLSTTAFALGMALSQRFKEDCDELPILQDAVSMYHPLFGKTFDFIFDQPVAEGALYASHLDHGFFFLSAFEVSLSARNNSWLSSQTASIASLSF